MPWVLLSLYRNLFLSSVRAAPVNVGLCVGRHHTCETRPDWTVVQRGCQSGGCWAPPRFLPSACSSPDSVCPIRTSPVCRLRQERRRREGRPDRPNVCPIFMIRQAGVLVLSLRGHSESIRNIDHQMKAPTVLLAHECIRSSDTRPADR